MGSDTSAALTRSERIALWAAAAVVLLVSFAFRVVDLGRIPGVSGDEAWYGVQVQEAIRGGHFERSTPTGNLLSPWHFGLLYIAHLVHPRPELWMLRLPSVISGVLLVMVAYPIMRRVAGQLAAVYAVILLACLPVNIAYSRLGWDSSHSVLVVMIGVGMVLMRWYLPAFAATAGAVLIHPTNILAVPIVAGPAVAEWLARLRSPGRMRPAKYPVWLLALCSVVGVLVFILPYGPSVRGAFARLLDIRGWADFLVLYGRLLSGVTVYQYIAGPVGPAAMAVHDAVFWLVALPLAGLGTRQWIRERRWRELGLAAALVLTLMGLYVGVGLWTIRPGTERYALFCVAPSTVLAAMWLSSLAVSRLRRRIVTGLVVFAGCALLTGFYLDYFAAFRRTGGLSHETFWTADVEPKKAAYDLILKESGDDPVIIVADSWWTYQPIRYLAEGTSRVSVWLTPDQSMVDEQVANGARLFLAGFSNGPFSSLSPSAYRVVGRIGLPSRDMMSVYEYKQNDSSLAGPEAAASAGARMSPSPPDTSPASE